MTQGVEDEGRNIFGLASQVSFRDVNLPAYFPQAPSSPELCMAKADTAHYFLEMFVPGQT